MFQRLAYRLGRSEAYNNIDICVRTLIMYLTHDQKVWLGDPATLENVGCHSGCGILPRKLSAVGNVRAVWKTAAMNGQKGWYTYTGLRCFSFQSWSGLCIVYFFSHVFPAEIFSGWLFHSAIPRPCHLYTAAPDVHEGLGQIQALTMYPQTINNNDDNDDDKILAEVTSPPATPDFQPPPKKTGLDLALSSAHPGAAGI